MDIQGVVRLDQTGEVLAAYGFEHRDRLPMGNREVNGFCLLSGVHIKKGDFVIFVINDLVVENSKTSGCLGEIVLLYQLGGSTVVEVEGLPTVDD